MTQKTCKVCGRPVEFIPETGRLAKHLIPFMNRTTGKQTMKPCPGSKEIVRTRRIAKT